MQVSKTSWHYRFNKYVQEFSFTDRANSGKLTTCSYIRTTIRSFLQHGLMLLILAGFIFMLGLDVLAAVTLPLFILMGWTVIEPHLTMAFVTYAFVLVFSLGGIIVYLLERYQKGEEKRLGLIRQRMADGKAGVCTIVEVV